MKNYLDFMRTWYYNPLIKFQLIKYTHNREFALLVPSWQNAEIQQRNRRNMRCHNVQALDWWIKYSDMMENKTPYQLYYSLAKYRYGLPYLKHDFKIDREIKDKWNKYHHREMVEYDCLIDVDGKNHKDFDIVCKSTERVCKYLKKLGLSFDLRFSGMGFHIIVPHKYFPKLCDFNPDNDMNIYQRYTKLATHLFDNYTELVDINIYDSRRIVKIPYSLALYEDGIYVCKPIIESDLKDFNIEDYTPDKIMKGGLKWHIEKDNEQHQLI